MNDDDVFNPGNIWKRSLQKATGKYNPWGGLGTDENTANARRIQQDKEFKDFLLNGLYKSEESGLAKRLEETEGRHQRLLRDIKDLLDMCPEAQEAWNQLMGMRRLQGEDEFNDSISNRNGR